MNLTQVLRTAEPDAPAVTRGFPRVYPNMIARDHHEREGHMVHVILPGGPSHFFRFSKLQYELIKLFDGQRSYAEIARIFTRKVGASITEDFVREFAENMDKKDFWYRSPEEESLALYQKLREDRSRKLKATGHSHGDLAIIELIYFDPDKFLTWAHSKLNFVYTWWFNAICVLMVGVMFGILGSRWDEIWADSVLFYNFTAKNLWDLGEFFLIFVVLGAVHETAHGMTCKHFGGESHKMGAFLMYLLPGVFCDVTQIYIYGGRWARIATLLAGVWSEIIICSWVSVVWWATAPGTYIHDLAYKFILSGGIFVVIINLNPLARMDGYYIFCEITRFFDLRSASISLTSQLVRKHIFRMPAKVPPMPRMRMAGFVTYALVAGAYSYLLLLFFVKILYRIMYSYSPEWAFIPATGLGIMIFKGRIKKLLAFLKALYLDKRELMQIHWKPISAGIAALFLLSLLPVMKQSTEQRFVLEPVQRATLRARVPGMVTDISASEGQQIMAGAVLARLRDLKFESEAALTEAQFSTATSRATDAQLRFTGYGPAELERQRLSQQVQLVHERQELLQVVAPIAGTITTPRLEDLVGSYVDAGTVIADIADTSSMLARIYVPESELDKIRIQNISSISLRLDGTYFPVQAKFVSVSPVAREVVEGLVEKSKYKGIHPPVYYVVTVQVPNAAGELKEGMTGGAHIYGGRESIFRHVFGPAIEAVARRLW